MDLFCTSIPKRSDLPRNSNLKMNMHLKPKSSFIRYVFVVLLLKSCFVTTAVSRRTNIVFENKVYKNVLLAINSGVEKGLCKDLIADIQKITQSLSTKLYDATDGKASLGSVDILLPSESEWSSLEITTYCTNGTVEDAKTFQTYDYADIKITNSHPIANSLPWTKQYRGCGQEAESIYIPPSFLRSTKFSESIKGNLLLQEWAKFRYGVFDEFGYFGDERFSPCYLKSGRSNFTSCSNSLLTEIVEPPVSSPEECETAVNSYADRIKEELSKGTSSLMAIPHIANVDKFCTSSNHNRLAPTKHNDMCNRKSVGDVLLAHKDFQNAVRNKTSFQNTNIAIRFIRQLGRTPNGYAFLIEDSESIRDKSRLKAIKQAITEMVNMMGFSTEVILLKFNGNVQVAQGPIPLNSYEDKRNFISLLPDQHTEPVTLSPSSRQYMSKSMRTKETLSKVYDLIKLSSYAYKKYNIILLGSSPATEIDEAIELTKNESNHSFSIVTFGSSPDWLKWNTIPHTENVLYIPPCVEFRCNGKLTSILTDRLLEILGNSQPRKFFAKVADFTLNGNDPVTFEIDQGVSRFFAVFPTFDTVTNNVFPSFSSPTNQTCSTNKMLNYDNLFFVNQTSCTLEPGIWTLNLADRTYFNFLQVYTEVIPGDNNLVITTALGHPLEDELLPTKSIVPVYASVSSSDQPIVDALVNLELFISDIVPSFTLKLLDNGEYPDVTKNDGVYSAVLTNYSNNPATHLGRINVNTTLDTRKIVELSPNGNAALLDNDLSTKCCGHEVPLQNAQFSRIGKSFYSVFIPSFKTNESFTSSDLPPSKISFIKITDNSNGAVVLEFTSPDSVHHYEICCFNEIVEMNCSAIPHTEKCIPVAAEVNQICSIQRTQLREIVNGTSGLIYCGIRGVSSKNIVGELSGNVLEIKLESTEDNNKCESISDGCLPIYIFWILIGCLAALVLIIVIGICCIIFSTRSRGSKKKNHPTQQNKNMVGKFPDKDSPLYNVYVNQAYIQDSDGQLKLVAADGELLPYDPNSNEQRGEDQGYATQNSVPQSPVAGKYGKPPTVRRRSISANATERENLSSFKDNNNAGGKHVSWNSNNNDMNMSVIGTNRNNYDDDFPEPYGQSFFPSEPNEFITVAPKPKDRLPKPAVGYANPSKTQSARSEATTMTPVPSITSTVEAHNRNNFLSNNNDDDSSVGPIYASVSRNGPRPYINNNHPGGVPVFNRFGLGNHPTSNPIVPKKPLNISNTTGDHPLGTGRFTRGYNNRKSVRLDAFPSSESETYSDISRGIPISNAPPLPPPLPSAGDLNMTKLPRTAAKDTLSHRTNGDGSDRMERNSSRNAMHPSAVPVSTSRSPPVDNSFAGIKTHLEQQMKNKTFNRPPPPPRHDKLPISSVSSLGSRTVQMEEVNPDEDYDEGSDFWDDGDDLDDFHQGQSYA